MDVCAWLEVVLDEHTAGSSPVVDADLLGELRHRLESAATAAVELLDRRGAGGPSPLRISKGRLADRERCERFALARGAGDGSPVELHRGVLGGLALDRYVAHQLHAGPVADPVEDLRSMLDAEGEWEVLAHLDALERDEALHELGPLAVASGAWAGVGPAWWPRTQSTATVVLAGGRVVAAGRVDVELGGPPSDRPGVVVEVKSGALSDSHRAETHHYALLVALRDRRAPLAAVRWYPGAEPAVVDVTAGVLESAARRLADGTVAWAELLAGREPAVLAGPWCRWCPEADRCPQAAESPEAPGGPDPDVDLTRDDDLADA